MNVEQRRRFLLELQFSGNVNFACRAAGVDRRAAYEVRHEDPVFENLWRRTVDKARKGLEERIKAA